MSYYHDLPQTFTYAGGILATTAAVVAETASTDPGVGAGSFLLGGAGLIAALSAFTKDFWQDRQKQREHELAKLRLRTRDERANEVSEAVLNWIRAARAADDSLPPAPEVSPTSDERDDT